MALTYYNWTIGCQMNQADSRHLAERLDALGLREVGAADQADVVILNTCVVRQQAENKVYGRLGAMARVKRERPEMVIALMGCLVGVGEVDHLRKRYPFVDVFVQPSGVDDLTAFLLERHPGLGGNLARDGGCSRVCRTAVTAFVPVVLGCSHGCAYCVIPSRRGPEKSLPPEEILREIETLAAHGIREVMLLGQIVDRYGLDFPGKTPRLPELLRRVAAIGEIERVRFLTSHPNWITDELIDVVATEPKVCPQLEIAVQSGSDAVLAGMKRGYTRERYLGLVERIRARIPDAAIHTDIIVGFPGETGKDFEQSASLLAGVEFDKVHIAKYSVRPGTPAEPLVDDVPPDEKERRRALLEDMQEGIQARRNKALEGQCVEVLVERMDKDRWQGRTPQNKIVFFEGPPGLAGRLESVRIDWAGPFSLVGRIAG